MRLRIWRIWHTLVFSHPSFSHPLLPCSLPPSVGVWYMKCFMIARAVRRHNRRRRQQPSVKCPCFPKWFFWQCFGWGTVKSALSSQIAVFNNKAAWQHDGGQLYHHVANSMYEQQLLRCSYIELSVVLNCHAGSPHLVCLDRKSAYMCSSAVCCSFLTLSCRETTQVRGESVEQELKMILLSHYDFILLSLTFCHIAASCWV